MTSFTTPATFTAGQTLTAAQLNQQVRDNVLHMTEIQSWTPTLTQNVTVSKTVTYARYWVSNKRVHATCLMTATSSGTAGQAILAGVPVIFSGTTPQFLCVGSGYVFHAGAAYAGVILANTSSTVQFRPYGAGAGLGAAVAPDNFGLVNGDLISMAIDYESS